MGVLKALDHVCTPDEFNPLTAISFNLNFHPRDPQLQVRFDEMVVNCFQILPIDVTFYV